MHILGIANSSQGVGLCLARNDGQLISQVDASRQGENAAFSARRIQDVVDQAGLTFGDIDLVVFAETPSRRLQSILTMALSRVPLDGAGFVRDGGSWLAARWWSLARVFADSSFGGRIMHAGRHRCLAADLLADTSFGGSACLVLDSGPGGLSTGCGSGEWGRYRPLAEQSWPHGLHELHGAARDWLGFDDDAAFAEAGAAGKPCFAARILDNMVRVREDGSFRLNMAWFFCTPNLRFDVPRVRKHLDLSGDMARYRNDLACSFLRVEETILARMLAFLSRKSGGQHLCVGGAGWLEPALLERLADQAGFTALHLRNRLDAARGAVQCGLALEGKAG